MIALYVQPIVAHCGDDFLCRWISVVGFGSVILLGVAQLWWMLRK